MPDGGHTGARWTGCPTGPDRVPNGVGRGARWGQTECPTGPDGVPNGARRGGQTGVARRGGQTGPNEVPDGG
jgi:hypothetical protein